MGAISEKRKGELYLYPNIVVWGLFPVMTAFSFTQVPSLLSYAWSLLFATLFFSLTISLRGKWNEIRNLELWRHTVFILLFIGIWYYGFYFVGLSLTTPGNAAIISLFEVLTSVVFFHILRRDHISREHVAGAALMILGALVVLGRNFSHVNLGDLFILCATLASPIGNLFQQRAREVASSDMVMFLRSATTIPFALALAYLLGMQAPLIDVRAGLVVLILNGVLFLGIQKVLWIEAIHRISVTKAVALSSLAPFVTLVAAWAVLNQSPTVWQLASLAPFVLGTLFLTDQISMRSHPRTTS